MLQGKQSIEKDEGSGFTSWQKMDCTSLFSMERYGTFLTVLWLVWFVCFFTSRATKEAKVSAGRSSSRQHRNECLDLSKEEGVRDLEHLAVMSLPEHLRWNETLKKLKQKLKRKGLPARVLLMEFWGFSPLPGGGGGTPLRSELLVIRQDKCQP